ncbi:hypothetical protein PR048_023640 [Dryococelus australis]|uniref:Uncharacterized protein n=1 Tax=Dryococelus australis TaxID=614101 RepID=A0ABQ9GUN3_9NEOP|nr:hypothetical protein PR048_023640 [Dryococelus australis]
MLHLNRRRTRSLAGLSANYRSLKSSHNFSRTCVTCNLYHRTAVLFATSSTLVEFKLCDTVAIAVVCGAIRHLGSHHSNRPAGSCACFLLLCHYDQMSAMLGVDDANLDLDVTLTLNFSNFKYSVSSSFSGKFPKSKESAVKCLQSRKVTRTFSNSRESRRHISVTSHMARMLAECREDRGEEGMNDLKTEGAMHPPHSARSGKNSTTGFKNIRGGEERRYEPKMQRAMFPPHTMLTMLAPSRAVQRVTMHPCKIDVPNIVSSYHSSGQPDQEAGCIICEIGENISIQLRRDDASEDIAIFARVKTHLAIFSRLWNLIIFHVGGREGTYKFSFQVGHRKSTSAEGILQLWMGFVGVADIERIGTSVKHQSYEELDGGRVTRDGFAEWQFNCGVIGLEVHAGLEKWRKDSMACCHQSIVQHVRFSEIMQGHLSGKASMHVYGGRQGYLQYVTRAIIPDSLLDSECEGATQRATGAAERKVRVFMFAIKCGQTERTAETRRYPDLAKYPNHITTIITLKPIVEALADIPYRRHGIWDNYVTRNYIILGKIFTGMCVCLRTHAGMKSSRCSMASRSAGETGDPEKNPPTSGIIRHNSHTLKPGTKCMVFETLEVSDMRVRKRYADSPAQERTGTLAHIQNAFNDFSCVSANSYNIAFKHFMLLEEKNHTTREQVGVC